MEFFNQDWVDAPNVNDDADYPWLSADHVFEIANSYALAAMQHEADFEIQASFWKSSII